MRLRFLLPILFLPLLILSCGPSAKISQAGKTAIKMVSQTDDSTEYEILSYDPGFEPWFVTNRKPEWYYTRDYLSNWNNQYVIAWNQKVRNTDFQLRNRNNPFIEEIYYLHGTDYGLEVEYKLYHYFQYIEATWGKILPYERRN